MKSEVRMLLRAALDEMAAAGALPPGALPSDPLVERARDRAHGDFATNVAMVLAASARRNPRELAAELVARLPQSPMLERAEVAGPGFINFHVAPAAYLRLVKDIRRMGERYGDAARASRPRVMVEFVSANPTGPLHVGHGRGAAYGDALVRVLRKAGHETAAEYYVNDAGRQMDILAVSVWLRYLESCGVEVPFPANAYRGDYVYDVAAACRDRYGEAYVVDAAAVARGLPRDDEQRIDALVRRARELLGEAAYRTLYDLARDTLVKDIRADLSQFRVEFDRWFSERDLVAGGAVKRAIARLDEGGMLYEKDGALWLRSSRFGDEKDRVVRRANGNYTYLASDVAYCLDKKERGFERLIYVWGADHHGYIARLRAAFQALGNDPEELTILLVQFASLYRGGERAAMSTRGGDFVSLRELRREVGDDAARFFYVSRKCEQHMDFDLELAKSQSSENPVYYVQYAHARVRSVFRRLREEGIAHDPDNADLSLLTEERELDLVRELSRFPEVVESAARAFEPHQVAYYVRELATRFHAYYNAHPFISSERALRDARLALVDAVAQVIRNGLELLGVSAPESM